MYSRMYILKCKINLDPDSPVIGIMIRELAKKHTGIETVKNPYPEIYNVDRST